MARSLEFARSLAEMRLLQTVRLLEWMLDNAETDVEAVATALGAVIDARTTIESISCPLDRPAAVVPC